MLKNIFAISLLLFAFSGCATQPAQDELKSENDAASMQPFTSIATFTGTIPCEDCAQVDILLNIRPDTMYQLRKTYRANDGTSKIDSQIGKWRYLPEEKLLVLGKEKGLLKTYLVESSNKLKFVEWEGTGTASQIQYELIRSAAVDPFQDKVKISGNFGLRGGIGFITECFTGYDFPVSKVKDYPRLLQNYMNTPHVSGQPLLASVIGTINTGKNDQTELIIEKFRSIHPENNCEGDKITSSLTGTFWRLIEVDTAQVTQTAGNKSVYLMLDSDRSFSAYGGCNLISGSYLLKGDQVVITRQKEARMACLDRIYLENKFIEALDSSQSLLVDGNILELKDQNNQVRARFQAGTLEQTNKQKQ